LAAGGNIGSYYVEDHVFDRPLAPFTTTTERLWLSVPYAIAARYAPESTQALLGQAAKNGVWHTLKYPPDLRPARRLDIARLDARRTLDCLKYAGTRLNK
jgi:D-aspartate ligase